MTARQKRTALAKRVVTGVKTLLVELKDLDDDIRQLWVEFENLGACPRNPFFSDLRVVCY